ncbi:methylmalonyl Co-A mutase-associated GTPase MeaB [Propionimicrobium sp. PCR01-08-3]|uniref:methylmalonyl Co-A mutase-associated GTPase MeaB n=1 Tax=Propionimicrobium sp. PCR01-08-3 TaxID=3052086 RepID=UPI00255C6D0C|nr:methylmalonyl Co-A mutase-associated GTPase MeaB [Propionimicrobium sp. PCR01-08-3]WIY81823.1 methylmalonyl Co-A mutase-associated GTPase MeaB [Propionimicrobium sp. PCR01-08-3]
MSRKIDVPSLIDGVKGGDRAALARAITLVESRKPAHRPLARELLRELTPLSGNSIRLGLSGVPGAGKSTFIDALGCDLIEQGHRVAVLAVDPTSSVSGGSVLGDRTRMGRLAESEAAFIRPSPTGLQLGGVARATREGMVLVEAAGYDIVIVETVGVGQSEVAVQGMVDTYLILMLARSGDQLQGIKKGILELAQVIAVNKADGDNAGEARVTARELSIAMKLVSSDTERRVPVLTCSALKEMGLEEVWQAVLDHRKYLEQKYGLANYRAAQQVGWMWSLTEAAVLDTLHETHDLRELARDMEAQVRSGSLNALDASAELLRQFAAKVPEQDWAHGR